MTRPALKPAGRTGYDTRGEAAAAARAARAARAHTRNTACCVHGGDGVQAKEGEGGRLGIVGPLTVVIRTGYQP